MAQYGKTSYWDERYTKDPEPFDWYQRYSGIKDLIAQYIKKSDNILMAGCGNSRLSEDMYDDGYTTVANVDTNALFVSSSALLRLKPCRNQPHIPLPVPQRRSQSFLGDVSRVNPVKALRLLNPTNKASNRTFDLISSHDQNSQSRLCLSRPLARWKHRALQARPTGRRC